MFYAFYCIYRIYDTLLVFPLDFMCCMRVPLCRFLLEIVNEFSGLNFYDTCFEYINLHSAKKVRFPKGKKAKPGVEIVVDKVTVEEEPTDLTNPVVAAKERAKRRSQITAELFSEDNRGISNDISAAEVTYEVCFLKFSLSCYVDG